MNRKLVVAAVAIILIAIVSSSMIWYFYRYDSTALSLTYETTAITSSPLSGANFTWTAKAYSLRAFGSSPFDGEGYVHRERIMSENRFKHTEFYNLNVSLKLRFEVSNATGYLLCNETIEMTDGCDRQIVFEFKPEAVKAGNTLEIRIMLELNVDYNYGEAGGEHKQFMLQKEWTRTITVQETEPETGTIF
ncbi:MAG: hypothetical protein OEY22_09195 [Candidatus Bathyarchaeota archaeon]|nr:hypothetical protein [Candidatus Bathyarchaeota archaeon]MDH5788034.1 hypothetical protein [Candidatus Bathyarchaeota archaeon]